jgi:predicted kinase
MLIVFGGLPGTGKTMIAKELARQLDGVYLRIDSIEQAICDSVVMDKDLYDAGYRVGFAVAEDNLRLGRTVIADSVNPLAVTREAWLAVAHRAQVTALEIEVKCSDPEEHRRRVISRRADIPALRLPTWEEVLSRDYEPWEREHLVIDTASQSVEQSVKMIRDWIDRDE